MTYDIKIGSGIDDELSYETTMPAVDDKVVSYEDTDYSNLSDQEIDALLKAKAAANPVVGPSDSESKRTPFDLLSPTNYKDDAETEWRFSEFNSAVGGAMAGGTIGMMLGGPPGAAIGGALGAEGTRRAALAGNEFLDWLDNKKEARIVPDSVQTMVEEAMTSANMIFADMAVAGLGSKIGVGFQKFKELFKGSSGKVPVDLPSEAGIKLAGLLGKENVSEFGSVPLFSKEGSPVYKFQDLERLSPTELKTILDKINIRGNPTLFGGPGAKRISVALSKLPTSAQVMQESINKTFDDIVKYSDELGESVYTVGKQPNVTSGKHLKEGLDAWSRNVKEKTNDVYKNIQGINKKEYIDLTNTKKALAAMKPKDLDKSSGSVFPSELKRLLVDIDNEKVIGKRPAISVIDKRKEFVDLPPKKVPRETKVNIVTEQYVDDTGEVFGEYVDADLAKRRTAIERPQKSGKFDKLEIEETKEYIKHYEQKVKENPKDWYYQEELDMYKDRLKNLQAKSGDDMKFVPKKRQITLVDEVDEAVPPAEIEFNELSVYVPEDPGIIKKPAGKLTWQDAVNARSAVGSKLSAPPLLRMGDKPTGQYSNVYAALTADLDNYALSKGEKTALQIKRARQYVAAFHKRKALVDMIADSDTAADAFNAALTGSKDGPERINALRKSIRSIKGDEPGDVLTLADRKTINGDDIWDEFVAANFWKFGRKPGGQQTSVEATDFGINTFLKNYSNMKKSGSLDAMLATPKLKQVKPELERFVKVLQEVKGLDELTNFSRTAEQTATMKMVAGGFGAAPGYALMGPVGLVVGPLATMGGPYGASKWLTSKYGLNFLTKAVKEASKIPNGMPQHAMRHLGRVLNKGINDMVKKDPSMADPAQLYLIEIEKLNSAINQKNNLQ